MLQRMYEIRLSTAADLPAVDALFRRVYPRLLKEDYAPSVRVLVLPRISRAQPKLLQSGTYFVAEEAGEILGAGGWTPDRRASGVGHIRHVVTCDRNLRRGIARAVLGRVFDQAAGQGVRRFVCWSTFTAEPFYAALGFQRQKVIAVPLDAGISFPAVEMTRVFRGPDPSPRPARPPVRPRR